MPSCSTRGAVTADVADRHPEAARGLEQELIQAVIDCLHPSCAEEGTAAQRRHTTIIRRFRDALEETADKAIYVPQLCATIGVSDRTLRKCCQEHFGMGPKRYLFLRRMHLTNQALRRATAAETTVTDIATEFGFWELGRLRGLPIPLRRGAFRQAPPGAAVVPAGAIDAENA